MIAFDSHSDYPDFGRFQQDTIGAIRNCPGSGVCNVDGKQDVGQARFDRLVRQCRAIAGATPHDVQSIDFDCSGLSADFVISNMLDCFPKECSPSDTEQLAGNTEKGLESSVRSQSGVTCDVSYETNALNEDDSSSPSVGLIVGVTVSAVVVVVLVILAVVFVKIKGGNSKQDGAVVDATASQPSTFPPAAVVGDSNAFVVTAPAGIPLGLTMGNKGSNGGFEVSNVKPNSPLANQVQVGDELTTLNNQDLTTMNNSSMLDALRTSTTQKVDRKLTFLRGSPDEDV